NRLLPLLSAASPLPSPIHIHPQACRRLCTSNSAATAAFSLEDYLVAACGIAPAQAREVSKKAFHQLSKISHSRFISAASNPDAIVALLSGAGLSRADIAAVVSAYPLLLRASVKRISPRLLALRDRAGLSTQQIARFLLVGPHAICRSDVVPKLQFFISFYGSFEQVLVVLKRNNRLFNSSLENLIKPNIALLRQWGVPNIVQLCSTSAWVLTFNAERVKEFLLRAEQLGVSPTSRMFRHAVAASANNPKEKVAAKLEFFNRTLGCSESEVSTAVSKMPAIIGLSDEILLRKIEFLVNEAAMEPQYIVERPVLLTLSLEKRLVPRHYVM
ncbi:hypothetical protein BDA96_03G115000, partial [Sorghum bicolor]